MDGMNLEKKKSANNEIVVNAPVNEQQRYAWDIVENYQKGSKIDTKDGAQHDYLDKESLFSLRDELLEDEDSKSKSFENMCNHVNNLAELAKSKGLKIKDNGEVMNANFFEVLYEATSSVNSYLFNHSGSRWTEKGERRIQVAKRLKNILDALRKEINMAESQMSEEKARRLNYAKEGLSVKEIEEREKALKDEQDLKDIMQIGMSYVYGPGMKKEDIKKVGKKWLENGVTEKLKDMAQNPRNERALSDLLAILENKAEWEMANKMAVNLLTEDSRSVTMDMPWLKEELRDYILDRLTEEEMTGKTDIVINRANELIKDFQTENEKKIKDQKARKDAIEKALGISAYSSNLYDYPIVKGLIENSDETEFKTWLDNMSGTVLENDLLIQSTMESLYPVGIRDAIVERLDRNLGALRAFGTKEQILDQMNIFCEMLKYTSPREHMANETLKNMMKDMGIEETYRDSFIMSVTGNNPSEFLDYDAEHWKKKGKIFEKKYKSNISALTKAQDKKGLLLTEEQWDMLEKLGHSAGELDKDVFKDSIQDIIADKDEKLGTLSRREYLTKRKFRDARNEPGRIERAKYEKQRMEEIGDDLGDLFMVQFANSELDTASTAEARKKADPLRKYRNLDLAYRGEAHKIQKIEEDEDMRYKGRVRNVKRLLKENGIPEAELSKYVNRCSRLISGVNDITDDMTDDQRLKIERTNLESFGVRTWDEALERFVMAAKVYSKPQGKAKVEEYEARYKNGRRMIDEYDGGKYKEYTDFLVTIPEVYRAMMDMDREEFNSFCVINLDAKLGSFIEGAGLTMARSDEEKQKSRKSRSIIPSFVRKQFAYAYLKNIYEGDLVGDAKFFEEHLRDFERRIYSSSLDRKNSFDDNIKAARLAVEKACYKDKIKDLSIVEASIISLTDMMMSEEDFLKLYDRDAVVKYALNAYGEIKEHVGKDLNKASVMASIKNKYEDKKTDDDIADDEAKIAVKKKRRIGLEERYKLLGVDEAKLEKIRLGKSLVRVGEKGQKRVDLKTSKADTMRGRIQKYAGNIELPPVLRDALVEEGASEQFGSRLRGIMWDNSKLVRHATAMNKMYSFLRRASEDDTAMSDEEAQMFIVRCYNMPELRAELFDNKDGVDIQALRSTSDYKIFRGNYERLMDFESVETDDGILDNERIEMARNLRAMLMTGVGLVSTRKNNPNLDPTASEEEKDNYNRSIGAAIFQNAEYLKYSVKVNKAIRQKVEEIESKLEYKHSEHEKDRQVYAVRTYFLSEIVEECDKDEDFDEDKWKERVEKLYRDKYLWGNLLYRKNSISSEGVKEAESSKIESGFTEESISNAIKANTYIFKGNVNKYEMLDEDQKKFFAVALMMMDKGSIGMGTAGTSALLAPRSANSADSAKIEKELEKYIAGEPYHLDIDYKEAFNKLVNYGETKFFYMEGFALSESAFNKALSFAHSVTARKIAFGERDDERLNNGTDSIIAAYGKYGKDQKLEIDKVSGEFLSIHDIRDKLKEYAKADLIDGKTILKHGLPGGAGPGMALSFAKDAFHNERMLKIARRFEKMSDFDLKLFVRLMQSRSVLDKTVMPREEGTDIPEYADQLTRNALFDALCSEDAATRSQVMEGFDDDESCHQAFINALSFQLRDDLNFKGKALTRDMYAKGALSRKTLVDWKLVESAFALMDEIKERRAFVRATRNAGDLINQSGNELAIAENKKFEEEYKDKTKFTEKKFESYIKKQCNRDGDEEIKRIVAGYHALTDKEKKLFFTVLKRRDLLDISKKNYFKNFFGMADRNYVNQTDRDKLIDRYIDSSIGDNVGIKLEEGAYYDALKTLFSTQLSDREKFNSNKKISDMVAYEDSLVEQRKTAIDWKLFRRALNFVNRATEELEYKEGNALLYRGAGLLSENGKISMNYSFLRRNFHKTGNQWGRFLGRVFVRTVSDQLELDDKLSLVLKGLSVTKKVAGFAGLTDIEEVDSGMDWLKNKVSGIKGDLKKTAKFNGDPNITKMKTAKKKKTEEEKEKEKKEEKERRENLLYFEQLKEGIDNVIAQAGSIESAMVEVGKYIRDNFATKFEATKSITAVKEIKAEEDKKNLVNKMTKGAKKDTSHQDIRDYAEKGKEMASAGKDILKFAGYIPGVERVKDIVSYSTQVVVYKFINESILKNEVDLSEVKGEDSEDTLKKQAKNIKREAEKVAGNFMESVFRDVVGDEFADNLLSLESKYYKDIKKVVEDQLDLATKSIKYAKKCVAHVTNVANAAKGIMDVKTSKEIASTKREEDDEKLERAGNVRLTPEQKAKVDKIVKKHRAMAGLSEEISIAVQSFDIAENVINLAFDTMDMTGVKLNPGQGMIASAIKAGIELAMFAARVATDRSALNRYFIDTEAGSAVVDKLKEGFIKAGNKKKADLIDERCKNHKESMIDVNTSLVDLISDARGYEHTSELMENTGMSLAQSIVFSASKYNPMAETRITAITVMSVMGLGKEVGSTSASTVEKLFKAFKMSR